MILRWVPLAVLIALGLSVIYRYAPSRRPPHWRWVSWGSAAATALWVVASMLFSFYVSHFGSYNKTYGSVGAVVIMMMWLYITAYIVLLGAEVDSEMEHQTVQDTTVGGEKPMGERQAYMADTVGEERPSKKDPPTSGRQPPSHAGG